MRMKNCIGCGKSAVCWSGHIHTEIGTITVGWCGDDVDGKVYCKDEQIHPNAISYCRYINPDSCYGEFKLMDIELAEELTTAILLQHARAQELSHKIDNSLCSQISQISKSNAPKRSFWDKLFN